MRFLPLLLIINSLVFVYCASILDFIVPETRNDENEPERNCFCTGPSCICCVDFNMSLIDLGGPGCVRIKYVSPEEGIALNVSYGDSLIHSETVKGPYPTPTCLKIFTTIAQMCARFTKFLPADDGVTGCLRLEPMLLGEVQIELPLGCLKMGPNGMSVVESSNQVIKDYKQNEIPEKSVGSNPSEIVTEEEEDDDTIAGLSTKAIIAAVSQSADEGIALISNWLGLAVNTFNKSNSTTNENIIDDESPEKNIE